MINWKRLFAIVSLALGAIALSVPAKADLTYTFTSGTDLAVSGSNYTPDGSLNLSLGFAPTPGTNLTVIQNTGLKFLSQGFSNLPQGATIPLTYSGTTYNYIANYYGGNGRSLVLQWPSMGLAAWGYNQLGQLGNNSTTQSLVPLAVTTNGALRGKTVVALAAGSFHSLALTSDGQIFAWGNNSSGQLGNSGTINSLVPVAVNATGALAGKTVVAIAASKGYYTGNDFSLALTSDGQVFAWGANGCGQLGNNTTTSSSVPVAVNSNGALAGKTVVALNAGNGDAIALTSDGQVFTWGNNSNGQLGNNSLTNSLEPVAVSSSGALAGRTVIAVAAGVRHCMAATSDGQVMTWGSDSNSQLGRFPLYTDQSVPGPVYAEGGSARVASLAAGDFFSLVLWTNGAMSAWGDNSLGQLGNNSTTSAALPVAVYTGGVLSGKMVTALAAGDLFSAALSSSGLVFAWGQGYMGQLGNNSQNQSSVPVAVSTSGLLAGKFVVGMAGGFGHTVAMFGSGAPLVTVNPVSQSGLIGSSVSFSAAATDDPCPEVQWQVSATGTAGPFSNITGNATATTGTLTLNSLVDEQNGYAYRAVFTNLAGSGTTVPAALSVIVPPTITASPVSQTALNGSSISFSAAASDTPAPCTVQWQVSTTGTAGVFSNITTNATATTGTLTLTGISVAQNGYAYRAVFTSSRGTSTTTSATLSVVSVIVTMNPASQTIASGSSVTFTAAANSYPDPTSIQWQVCTTGTAGVFSNVTGNATATTPALTLTGISTTQNGYAYRAIFSNPAGSGTTSAGVLTVVNVMDTTATFSSAADIPLTMNEVVSISGSLAVGLNFAPPRGTSLTVIKNTGLGFISGKFSNVPQGGTVTLAYNGVSYSFVANYYGGNGRSLVLQWPWTGVSTWGADGSGQLGDGGWFDRSAPILINGKGAMLGKTVVAVAGGNGFSLALSADGQLFAWGTNSYGQFGNNSTVSSNVPVAVSGYGALVGKTVVAIAAGSSHCLALSSEGQVFAWGYNWSGQLGNNSTASSLVPVAVTGTGALAYKQVVAIAAGSASSYGLTSEGNVFAWGANNYGQLGNNSNVNSSVPVAVSGTGVLAGKTVTAIAGGQNHCLALTADGAVVNWGYNSYGQLGINSTTNSWVPVAVSGTGALAGETLVAVAAGNCHSLALASDGKVFTWGGNDYYNQLKAPTAITGTGALAGKIVTAIAAGYDHDLVLSSDGQVFSWGYTRIPALVSNSGVLAGNTATTIAGGNGQSLALFNSAVDLATPTAPSVSANPVSQTLVQTGTLGTTVVFSAATNENFLPFTVQWQVSTTGTTGEFTDISDNPSATTGKLTLANVTIAQNGYAYRAIFANSAGTCTTAPAALNVVGWPDAPLSFTSASDIPVTADQVSVSGSLAVALGFAPAAGTSLTVINNTGPAFISGTFSNVAQGGKVKLTYNGVTYSYIANYFGGNGRSLVLEWPWVGLDSWGFGNLLGNGGNTTVSSPVAVTTSGALVGKRVVSIAAGQTHTLALSVEGEVFAWGNNTFGQLGNPSVTSYANQPVAVVMNGALAGKKVVAIAAGYYHSLALTSDGKVYSWGNAGTASVPVAVDPGALAGKTVVAIAAGKGSSVFSVALTSEGRVYAWGDNSSGQLGNHTKISNSVPVEVDATGALAGRSVVGIGAGWAHCLALTADGKVFGWGANSSGNLGDNSTTNSSVPVTLDTTGELLGKRIVGVAAGSSHNLALSSEGQVYGWGANDSGQLGTNNTVSSLVPVAVFTSGALSGKTVTSISAGYTHSLAISSDGKLFSWGLNSSSQLGVHTPANTTAPLLVGDALAGQKVLSAAGGASHSVAAFGAGSPSVVSNPNNLTATEGTNPSFYASATDNPTPAIQWQVSTTGTSGPFSDITGNATATQNFLTLTSVTPAQSGYAYRAIFDGFATTTAATLTVNPLPVVTTNPVSQKVQAGSAVLFTAASPDLPAPSIQWQVSTTGAAGPFSNITGNATATTGTLVLANAGLPLNGSAYRALLTNAAGTRTTTVATLSVVSVLDPSVTFSSATDVPLIMSGTVSVSGSLSAVLGFAPPAGTNLTVIKNTGLAFLSGTFQNVAQGATIPLTFNGTTYNFVANYYGGNGRSLVLQWPCTEVAAWGWNFWGQLGINNTTDSPSPIAVDMSGALAGKKVMAVAAGFDHSLALTSDGKVYAWGHNFYGQLGINSTLDMGVPVAVNASGALAGKTVVAIAGGNGHSLALTSEGQVFAWGYNNYGQLGNNSTTNSSVPVAVSTNGALAGKTVVAIEAGDSHCLALTSDGKVFCWGYNCSGQLGNSGTTNSSVPVAVSTSGTLSGKAVAGIAGSFNRSMALTVDGQIFAWGDNSSGQLGNNSTSNSSVPVAVDTSGVLAGSQLTAMAGGGCHSLALSSDGLLYAWGWNPYGELGNNSTTDSPVPVAVSSSGELAGKKVAAISAGIYQSMALTSDGQLFSWGNNANGGLGNGGTANSSVPTAVDTSGELSGKAAVAIAGGFYHTLAMIDSGAPAVISNPENQSCTTGAAARFVATASGDFAATVQWQVSTTGSAGPFFDISDNATAITGTLSMPNVSPWQDGYAYRAVFTNAAGSAASAPALLRIYSSPVLLLPGDIILNASSKDGAAVDFSVSGTDRIDGNLAALCSATSGSIFPIGTTIVNCSVSNGGGLSTSGSFSIKVRPSFAAFENLHGLPDSGTPADLLADLMGTGICNLSAYAFGISPWAPDRSQLPRAMVVGGHLQITYPRWKEAADVAYIVEVGDDLQNWHSGTDFTQQISVTSIDGTREWITEADKTPVSSVRQRFIRVRLEYRN